MIMTSKKLLKLLVVTTLVLSTSLSWGQSESPTSRHRQAQHNLKAANMDRLKLSPETSAMTPKQAYQNQYVDIQVSNSGNVSIKGLSFRLNDDVKEQAQLIKSSDQDSPKTNCNDVDKLVSKSESGSSKPNQCTYRFLIKSGVQEPEIPKGQITITSENADNKQFYVHTQKQNLTISKTVFDQPVDNSQNPGSDVHKAITVTNTSPSPSTDNTQNGKGGLCFEGLSINPNQEFGSGITVADNNFEGSSSGSLCFQKHQCDDANSKPLNPGDQCQININIANDASGSIDMMVRGDFGEKAARINVPSTRIAFFKGSGTDGDPIAYMENDNSKQAVTLKNLTAMGVHDLQITATGGLSIEDNKCDGDLKGNSSCEVDVKLKSDSNLGTLEVGGANLISHMQTSQQGLARVQELTVGDNNHCHQVVLSRSFLKHNGSFATSKGEISQNSMVYRLIAGSSLDSCEVNVDKSKFLNADHDLSIDEFKLRPVSFGCYDKNENKVDEISGGDRCDRIVVYTPETFAGSFGLQGFFDVEFAKSSLASSNFKSAVTSLLYVGGHFSSAGKRPNTTNIAKWNGKRWGAVGVMEQDSVINALAFDNSGNIDRGPAKLQFTHSLYAGGQFDRVDELTDLQNVAIFQGCSQCAKPLETDNHTIKWPDDSIVHTFSIESNAEHTGDINVYTGGNFSFQLFSDKAKNMAFWSLTDVGDAQANWKALEQQGTIANGTSGPVLASYWDDDRSSLLVAGAFDEASGIETPIAEWHKDEQQWSDMGNNTDDFEGFDINQSPVFYAINRLGGSNNSNKAWFVGGQFALHNQPMPLLAYNPGFKFSEWQSVSGVNILTKVNRGGSEQTLQNPRIVELAPGEDNYFYVGGKFGYQDANDASNKGENLLLCQWNTSGSTSKCQPQDLFNPNDRVRDMLHLDMSGGVPVVFVGGDFTQVDGQNVNHIFQITSPVNSPRLSRLKDDKTQESIASGGTVNAIVAGNKVVSLLPSG